MNKNELFRAIPKVDVILSEPSIQALVVEHGKEPVTKAIRKELDEIRNKLVTGKHEGTLEGMVQEIPMHVIAAVSDASKPNLKRVINATGVILHTNLGRAPLPEKALKALEEQMRGYMNLEYDLEAGRRGERYSHFEKLVCKITGAEAAMAVNNNAAAALLMVSAIGAGKEVIVSRGEQIEIGGKFRIPDIIDQSGAIRVEVGTTNKTRLEDYEEAITEETGALLKVHTSNYKVIGFSESVERKELVKLSHKHEIPVIEDLGSGVLIDLSRYGLGKEPTVQDSIAAGVDVVCFSGDKLFGGPQAGILVGKKEWIEKCKKHPLTRAMRIDKCTAAMLESVFRMYEDESYAVSQIPVLSMIATTVSELEEKAQRFCAMLAEELMAHSFITILHCKNPVGGGSLPGELLESVCVAISNPKVPVMELATKLRSLDVPVIGRIEEEQLILDMRTVHETELKLLADTISKEYLAWNI